VATPEYDRRRHGQLAARFAVLAGGGLLRLLDLFEDPLGGSHIVAPRIRQLDPSAGADEKTGSQVLF
jgi:hypothetical protein